jgi:hypothetical protein
MFDDGERRTNIRFVNDALTCSINRLNVLDCSCPLFSIMINHHHASPQAISCFSRLLTRSFPYFFCALARTRARDIYSACEGNAGAGARGWTPRTCAPGGCALPGAQGPAALRSGPESDLPRRAHLAAAHAATTRSRGSRATTTPPCCGGCIARSAHARKRENSKRMKRVASARTDAWELWPRVHRILSADAWC